MIRAVLFDLDGVLADSEAYYLAGTLAWMRGLGWQGEEKDLYGIIGAPMDEIYDILYHAFGKKIPRAELVKRNEKWSADHPADFGKLMFDGVPQVLAELRQAGIRTALCSAGDREYVHDALEQAGIRECFDVILCGSGFPAKPQPDIYLAAAEMLGIGKEECAVYEDSRRGIAAGKRAGMHVIARREERFGTQQEEADLIVNDIYEMKQTVFGGILCRKSSE